MNYWLMKSEPDVFGIDHLVLPRVKSILKIIPCTFGILLSRFKCSILFQLLLQPLFKCLGRQLDQLHQLDLLGRELLGEFELKVLFQHRPQVNAAGNFPKSTEFP